jgi:hypothetical protein
MDVFHQYAFATLRQCGACTEMAATYLRWMAHHDAHANQLALHEAADAFTVISSNAKTLQFKVARTVSTRKPADIAPLFDAMEEAWITAGARLTTLYGA